jgi:nondiscriminating aspartyl-tRNA synthetase
MPPSSSDPATPRPGANGPGGGPTTAEARTPIAQVFDPARNGQRVRLEGWVDSVRSQKTVEFVILRDATGRVQLTHKRGAADVRLSKPIAEITPDSTVDVEGTITVNPSVKLGGVELLLHRLDVRSLAAPLPIDENADQDARLDWRFVDLRRPRNQLIFRVQTALEHAMRQYWVDHGFVEIHSPKLMGSPSESGAELFELEYFGKKAYLSQSPQFYKQMGMAAGFDRVFEIGPVFRANPSFTSRHDTEFTSVDVEIAWVDSHQDVMAFEERWLQYALAQVKEKLGGPIRETFGVEVEVPTVPFPRITFRDAVERVAGLGHRLAPNADLDPEGERILGRSIREEHGHDFVFVTDYPIELRPFYHMRHADEPTLTKSFDLLWKGLEITTGAQREHRYEVLRDQAVEKGLSLDLIAFYLDFFRFGVPPHGGFGFGLTRTLMNILGLHNVRDVTYLYRGPTRLSP